MTVSAFRLVKRKWAHQAFDGEGTRWQGGCWNSQGNPCVYLAGSESLALLEVMVRLQDYSILSTYTLFRVELPEELIEELARDSQPATWRDPIITPAVAALGDQWLCKDERGLALGVPSVVVSRERNFLLNIAHPMYVNLVEQAQELEFDPDPRLE